MSIMTPLVFVLSTGSDPFGGFQRFALEMGFKERVQSISLGQGQGPVAEKMIKLGASRGDWVFLQVRALWVVITQQSQAAQPNP
uniref:Dynein heavy chain region D6 P-loop domain-containing protein n=1 Tax=Timema monikensis TaxID=170555 RepID=A0A7R9E1L1_9NEOP|nr:unnamed protein product [Timema monikensis]